MKLFHRILTLTLAVALLSGCGLLTSRNAVRTLNQAQAVGSPFTRYLAEEYRNFANHLQSNTFNYKNAIRFAHKGLAAADGVVVQPETIHDWNLNDTDILELTMARAELMDALESGGREIAPAKSAIAQSRFDCWLEQQERYWNFNVSCKYEFRNALINLKGALDAATTVIPAPAVPPPPPADEFPSPVTGGGMKGEVAPVEQAMFIVFFDWNKYTLSSSANDVLDAIAQELTSRQDVRQVVVVGHADTSGERQYNQKLSIQRAHAVQSALAARGVPDMKLRIEGRGEDDLLVKTPDNVREPGNRRAQISLE
jgi:OOP family OmpA-OmpF porin